MSRARDLAFPKFNYYKPKDHHPDWKELEKEALQLAVKIARRIKLQTNYLQRTLFQKRKMIAILETARNLFINKRRASLNDHNFIPGKFRWQRGYGAFSVSMSQLSVVEKYIKNQNLHHKRKSFKEEYVEWVRKYAVFGG